MRNLKDAVMVPFLALLNNYKFSPNYITILSGIVGLIGIYFTTIHMRYTSCAVSLFGRILDGLDGAYARNTKQTSDFGGYLDILVDFTIYGLVPLAVTATYPSYDAWFMCVLLEVSFFVNSAGLFFLSALIEKNENARKNYKTKKEVTTLKMPPALMEGTESLFTFGLIIIFPEYQIWLYTVFCILVVLTIL